MADGSCTRTDFHIANRQGTVLNAGKPVFFMVAAFVQVHFTRFDGLINQTIRPGAQIAAVNLNFAFATEKANPIGVEVGIHWDAIRINIAEMF